MVSEESPLLASAVHELIYDRFEPDQRRWIVFLVSVVDLLPTRDLDSTHAVISLTISLSILASAVGALVWAAFRLSTFGCSGGLMSLGAGGIGDIYKSEKRGTAIGATLFGGVAAQYWSWRNLHYCLGVWGLLEMLLIHLSFPEMSHPGTLGIDKVTRKRWIHITWVNPLSSLWLLRSPNLFAVMSAFKFILTSNNLVLLVPLVYTIGIRYNITNQAIIGACFLPNGLGNFIRRWQKKREGVWCPEDCLRATWIGGLIIVPLSIGASGLITAYIGGPMGLWLNLLCLFTTGMGCAPEVQRVVWSLILSAATALVIPSIEHIGVAWMDIIAAVLALIGQGIIFLTISYGDCIRASVDIGFTTENR
ncbi:hypothetical protein EDB19DRAFT_2028478 [Suillus lakei]|nr:hypothetical protein EDB19DRAFT_2028478 [Suillus lakei]